MSAAGHVVLIHGTWARGDGWGPAQTAFEERGFTVHTPTRRHHELPLQERRTEDRASESARLHRRPRRARRLAGLAAARRGVVAGGPVGSAVGRTDQPRRPRRCSARRTRQASSLRLPRHSAASGVSSQGTICSRGRGPNRCIPQRGNGFGGGSPTPRPRRSPATYSPASCGNRGAPTVSWSSGFWTAERQPPSTSLRSRRQCSRFGANMTTSRRYKSPLKPRPGARREPVCRFPAPTTSSFSGMRFP